MSCADWKEAISRAADGDLTVSEGTQLERHLAGCSGCRAEHEAVRLLQQALAEGPDPDAEGMARSRRRVLAMVYGGEAPAARPSWSRWLVRLCVPALAVALLVLSRDEQTPPAQVALAPETKQAGRLDVDAGPDSLVMKFDDAGGIPVVWVVSDQ